MLGFIVYSNIMSHFTAVAHSGDIVGQFSLRMPGIHGVIIIDSKGITPPLTMFLLASSPGPTLF